MSSRKILITVLILVVVVFCVGLYFLFSPSKTASAPTQTGQTGTLPATGTQSAASSTNGSLATDANAPLAENFGMISNQPVLNYFVDANNNAISIQPDGEIDETTGGQNAVLNALEIQNIISAGFSHDGKKVLVNFGDPTDPQTSIFDITAKAWTPMSAGWLSPAWSPSDYRVAYATESSNGTETFFTLDASKPNAAPVTLLTLHAQDLSLAWMNANELILETKPSALVAGSAWLLNITTKALTPIAVEIQGLETAWSAMALGAAQPLGLEFSVGASELGGSLQLVGLSGNAVQQISFLTLPSKCAFASATSTLAAAATSTLYLYCGVPRDQSDLAFDRLPDAYNQMSLFTSDDIYRINLSSGAIDTVFANQMQNLDVSDVKLFNNTLFFINRYDEKLYATQLAPGV